ncbi:MAG: VWA domain-containing protein [Bacteroidota bacterium]|nr:VWA domain-containing protein [Bacteroidota bacterium]
MKLQKQLLPFLVFVFASVSSSLWAQEINQQALPDRTRILFVLDGSGSMNATWAGNQSRMDVAKAILTRLVDSLRVNPKLELALRVYGHRYSRQSNNCTDSQLEVPFGLNNHNRIINEIKDITPRGVTPITYSLLQAANDFPAATGYRNIVILITDGVESCGGDPCEASIALQKKGVFLRPFIIGLGVPGGKALDCVGKFIDAENAQSFNKILNESIETTFALTTVSVELLNGENQPVETNINITFVNSMTGTAAYEFVHYLDAAGKPDSVQIDPVLSYDVVVNTLPPVVRRNVQITNGKHNVVRIPAPQGSVIIKPEGRGNPFRAVIRQKGKGEILHEQASSQPYRYLEGDYELETLTLPRRIFPVSLKAGKTVTITLPSAGAVNVNTLTPGYGSVFEILTNGESQWVCTLDETKSRHFLNLLPGNYKIAFRARRTKGSKYTAIKTFEVKPGQTLNLNIFD